MMICLGRTISAFRFFPFNSENKKIDIPLAAEALKDMISPDNNREVTPELIIDIVSEHFNIPILELKGKKRNAEIVLPIHEYSI